MKELTLYWKQTAEDSTSTHVQVYDRRDHHPKYFPPVHACHSTFPPWQGEVDCAPWRERIDQRGEGLRLFLVSRPRELHQGFPAPFSGIFADLLAMNAGQHPTNSVMVVFPQQLTRRWWGSLGSRIELRELEGMRSEQQYCPQPALEDVHLCIDPSILPTR